MQIETADSTLWILILKKSHVTGTLQRHDESDPAMNPEQWHFWKQHRKTMSESLLLRYGAAAMLTVGATLIMFVRPSFAEEPYFIFLGAVVLSAVNGGLAPAFLSTALSALIIRLLFIHPKVSLFYGSDYVGMEQMAGFILVSMLLSSFVSAIRRDRSYFRDSEERYRMLAEATSDAIIVIDGHGEILYVNAVAEKTFGRPARDLLGQNLALLLPGEGYQAKLSEMKRDLDSRKKAVAVQLPGLHRSGGQLLIEMTLCPSCNRGKNLFTATIRDLTGAQM